MLSSGEIDRWGEGVKSEIAQLKEDIKDIKENIEVRKGIGKSYVYEEMLLKAWKRRLKKWLDSPQAH